MAKTTNSSGRTSTTSKARSTSTRAKAAPKAKAAAPKTAAAKRGASAKPRQVSADQIAHKAYEIWEKRGRPEGTQHEDWSLAERELLARAG